MDRRHFLGIAAGLAPALVSSTAMAQAAVSSSLAAAVTNLAALLENEYVIPATGKRYAAMLRARLAAGSYSDVNDVQALATRLSADLAAVSADGHLRVVPVDSLPATERPGLQAAAERWIPTPNGKRHPGPLPIEDACWLAPRIGYIRFTGFPDDPAVAEQCAKFMHDHATDNALIIDCRYNGGGGIRQMNAMLPFLYAHETTLVRFETTEGAVKSQHGTPFDGEQFVRSSKTTLPGIVAQEHFVVPQRNETRLFDKPIYYLISNRTASAAEHLALALKRTKRATLVGEVTAGANHFGDYKPIGSGLAVFLPVGRSVDPDTGADWEGVGILPDVSSPPAMAVQEALRRAAAAT